jgi:dTDP-4-amino-4,6-dideoxygalactose transaminase
MINVTKTYLPDIDQYKGYIDRIYKTGWVTNNGELVIELENRLKKLLNARNIILLANGTLALQVLYKALDLKGEVITTPFSFVATTSSIVWEGLKPVFADIDPSGLGIDPAEIEKKITTQTSAIVGVHVFGNPCDVDSLSLLADKYKLKLIYDAAHAFMVKYRDIDIVNFGDASTLSFHATKIFHTIEGGAIVTNDDELSKKIRLMINFGISGYDTINALGTNAKMNEFQAAMGLAVLDHIDQILTKRKLIFEQYVNAFRNHKVIVLQEVSKDIKLNYSYFPIILQSNEMMNQVKTILNNHQIFPRRYFYPSLESLPYLSDKQYVPNSESIAERILCLPIYEDLDKNIVDAIIDLINEVTLG